MWKTRQISSKSASPQNPENQRETRISVKGKASFSLGKARQVGALALTDPSPSAPRPYNFEACSRCTAPRGPSSRARRLFPREQLGRRRRGIEIAGGPPRILCVYTVLIRPCFFFFFFARARRFGRYYGAAAGVGGCDLGSIAGLMARPLVLFIDGRCLLRGATRERGIGY